MSDMQDHKCPKCGYIMCEQADEKQGPNNMTLLVPNGKYECLHCKKDRAGTGGKRMTTKAEINAIYRRYPRRIAKANAVKAIAKALQRLVEGEAGDKMEQRGAECFLAAKVAEYAESLAGNRGRYTPHPATWFNGSQYLDDTQEWNRGTDNKAFERARGNRDAILAGFDLGGGAADVRPDAGPRLAPSGSAALEGNVRRLSDGRAAVGVQGTSANQSVLPKTR